MKEGNKMKISDSEMEIMNVIWSTDSELSCADITQRLNTSWKQTTIQTFLKRLCDKGVLDVRKEGKTNFYSARISEDEYKREQTEEFLNETHKGSVESLLTALFGAKEPDKKELEEIKEWFEEI